MRYAEVSVNSPIAQRRTFSYAMPQGQSIEVGQAVWVPFGEKLLQGIVLELSPYPEVEETKEIAGVIELQPLLSRSQVLLARWISEYYLSPLFDAVALMLPPGFERKAVTFISSSPTQRELDASSLTEKQQDILELVQKQGKISIKELEKRLGKRGAQTIISQLVGRGLVVRSYELEPIKIRPKQELYLSLEIAADEARPEAAKLRKRGAAKQAALLDLLAQQSELVPWVEARQRVNCDKVVADALVNKGLIKAQQIEVKRDPISYENIRPSYSLRPTAAQRLAFDSIKSSLSQLTKGNASPPVFLLYGVTGSGKTEVYLQALAEAVRLGKRGIVLVSEIALTPQTIERFAARFPRKVAVLHSKLSLGEQFDEWQRIKSEWPSFYRYASSDV